MPWNVPVRMEDIGQLMQQTKAGVPDPDPPGQFWVEIGCARKSSHPGADTMQQVYQNLIQTMQTYENVIDNPFDQASPEVAGHLSGLQVQRSVLKTRSAGDNNANMR